MGYRQKLVHQCCVFFLFFFLTNVVPCLGLKLLRSFNFREP